MINYENRERIILNNLLSMVALQKANIYFDIVPENRKVLLEWILFLKVHGLYPSEFDDVFCAIQSADYVYSVIVHNIENLIQILKLSINLTTEQECDFDVYTVGYKNN